MVLFPGQVNGNFVTYSDCRGGCKALRYDITADTTTTLPGGSGNDYGSAITPDGTTYILRDTDTDCSGAQIVRAPIAGPQVVIASIPTGRDIAFMFASVNADSSVDLFFNEYRCTRAYPSDVYEIPGADTAPAVAAPAPTSASVGLTQGTGRQLYPQGSVGTPSTDANFG
jgi:hypothetical protein